MRMSLKMVSTSTACALAGVLSLGLAPAPASAVGVPAGPPVAAKAAKQASSSVPVTGTLADGTAFNGALTDLDTTVVDGVLQLTGTVTGTGLPADGTSFSTPIQSLDAPDGCSVLNLDLGPLHLDLLGLVIDLAPVNLDITAVPGGGKLLGNLVCAISHLLDNGGPLQAITALLDRLLSGLGLRG